MPTDALSHAREVVAGMTAAPWHLDEAGIVATGWGLVARLCAPEECWAEDDLPTTIQQELSANAAGIVLAVAILRTLADPATVAKAIAVHQSALRNYRKAKDAALPHYAQVGEHGHTIWAAGEEEAAMQAVITFILDQAGRDAT